MSSRPAPASTAEGLAVVGWGPADRAQVVVLVHGTMDRAASFGRVARRLEGLRVVAYDRRGYAGSLGLGATSDLDVHAADLLAVARGSGAASALLVGHSFGGLVALRAAVLAERDGDRPAVRGVGCFEAPMPWRAAHGRSAGATALEVGRRDGAVAAAEAFFRSMAGDAAWDRIGPEGRRARRAEGRALLGDLHAARDPAAEPAGVAVAVHSACGTRSPARLRDAAAELARRYGTPLTVLEGAGHGAHLTHPSRFADWVRSLAVLPTAPGRPGRPAG